MKLSELIQTLQLLKEKHGDLPVYCQTLSHVFAPEPELRPFGKKPEMVLLNP